jgi:hypothetical protein
MPSYQAEPVQLPRATIVIGDTYDGPIVTIAVDGVGVSLAGATIVAKIREAKDPTATVLLTPATSVVDEAGGQFTWSAEADDTAELTPCGAVLGVQVTWADRKKTVLEQAITIRYGVV